MVANTGRDSSASIVRLSAEANLRGGTAVRGAGNREVADLSVKRRDVSPDLTFCRWPNGIQSACYLLARVGAAIRSERRCDTQWDPNPCYRP